MQDTKYSCQSINILVKLSWTFSILSLSFHTFFSSFSFILSFFSFFLSFLLNSFFFKFNTYIKYKWQYRTIKLASNTSIQIQPNMYNTLPKSPNTYFIHSHKKLYHSSQFQIIGSSLSWQRKFCGVHKNRLKAQNKYGFKKKGSCRVDKGYMG